MRNTWLRFALVVVALAQIQIHTLAAGPDKQCGDQLSPSLPDSAFSASSFYVSAVGPQQASGSKCGWNSNRDESPVFAFNGTGAWCPKQPIAPGVVEWIQLDLGAKHAVTGVVTQGRWARGIGQEYAPQFRLQYSRDEGDGLEEEAPLRWRDYLRFDGEQELAANSDTSTPVTNVLRPMMVARRVRLIPVSPHLRTVCVRLEILGCEWSSPVLRYSAPQGDLFSPALSFRDRSYDGGAPQEEGEPELLSGGLGQLVDGQVGLPSFGMDIGLGWGNAWVGWKRRPGRSSVQITFDFNSVQRCRGVALHINNAPAKGVEVFAKAVLQFSVGGVHYGSSPRNTHVHIPSPAAVAHYGDSARNETILFAGAGLVGKFMRLTLFFRGEWLLLSEVYFDYENFTGNVTAEGDDDPQMDVPVTQSSSPGVLQGAEGDGGSLALEISLGVVGGVLLLAVAIGSGLVAWNRRNRDTSRPNADLRQSVSVDCCAPLKLFGYPADRLEWRFVPRNGDETGEEDCGGPMTPPRPGGLEKTVKPSRNEQSDLVKDMLVSLTPGRTDTCTRTQTVQRDTATRTTPPPKYPTLTQPRTLHQYDNYGSTQFRRPKPLRPEALAGHGRRPHSPAITHAAGSNRALPPRSLGFGRNEHRDSTEEEDEYSYEDLLQKYTNPAPTRMLPARHHEREIGGRGGPGPSFEFERPI